MSLYHSRFIYFLLSAETLTFWSRGGLSVSVPLSKMAALNRTHHTPGHTDMALLSSASNTLLLLFSLIMNKVQHDYSFPPEYIFFSFSHL